ATSLRCNKREGEHDVAVVHEHRGLKAKFNSSLIRIADSAALLRPRPTIASPLACGAFRPAFPAAVGQDQQFLQYRWLGGKVRARRFQTTQSASNRPLGSPPTESLLGVDCNANNANRPRRGEFHRSELGSATGRRRRRVDAGAAAGQWRLKSSDTNRC